MRCSVLAALLGLANSVQAAAAVLLEQAKSIPPGWTLQGIANASDKITLFVALKQPGIKELKAKLNQRQNPDHPSFGQHLTRDEVLQHRQPAYAADAAVSGWLKASGIRDVHNQGSLISFEASAKTVKSLFQADLAYYAYNGSDTAPVLRALSYTIPVWLRDSIDFVHPITNFIPPRPSRGHRKRPRPWKPHPKPTNSKHPVTPSTPTGTLTPVTISTATPSPSYEELFPNMPCLAATVPDCIKKLYNITYTPPSTSPSPVRLGIAGFLEQWILHSDVSLFLDTFSPSLPRHHHNFTVELFHNATNPQDSPANAGLEASLDVQYALSLAYPARTRRWRPTNPTTSRSSSCWSSCSPRTTRASRTC
ncbi:hypothetical protein VTI74DRAFT_7326 [Chaetomium olivicolor]